MINSDIFSYLWYMKFVCNLSRSTMGSPYLKKVSPTVQFFSITLAKTLCHIQLNQPALQIRASQQSIIANIWPLTAHIYHVMIIVTGDFSKKSFFIIILRRSHTGMFFKTVVIRNFAIFTEKHLCWNLFFIKLQTLRPATLFQPFPKRDFNTGVLL